MTKDREICEAAARSDSPPWWTSDHHSLPGCIDVLRGASNTDDTAVVCVAMELSPEAAAYIAHFDPEYQVRLLDVVDAVRKLSAWHACPGYIKEALAALDADGAGEDEG